MERKNTLFTIGAILIALSFGISIIPYFLFIGLLIYVPGVVLVWLSDKKTIAKILWTFIPVVILWPLAYLLYEVL